MPFDQLAIIDTETTGTNAKDGRVIEIGILIIKNGQIQKTYQQLFDPERNLPPFITSLTGIEDKDLYGQPKFAQKAREIHSLIRDKIFVAHNAGFDFGFLREEFTRCGLSFTAPQLCSVKLSRKLFPKVKGHSLDKIMERFDLNVKTRHRALDDAKVIWDFFEKLQGQFEPLQIKRAIRSIMTHRQYELEF